MISLDLTALRNAYTSGRLKPSDVIESLYARLEVMPARPVFIGVVTCDQALQRARELEQQDISGLPLYGVPFAVKDNIDVEGMETTAGCPAYAYHAVRSATVVERLLAAGAILIGKTNLDQFATGLVGTRSPYGACSSVFDERYVSGGSSSGSAVAVARALVSFALGTDTAGSGRVPAAFNNIVGLKPTRGLISLAGVVPACRSLDCVSVFAMTCADAYQILKVSARKDPADPFSRMARVGDEACPWLGGDFRFGCPDERQLEFFGDSDAAELYRCAITALETQGGKQVTIDFTPFRQAAELLYSGPWVAERYAAVGPFVMSNRDAVDPTVGGIIARAASYSAADAFRGVYDLETLRQSAEVQWQRMDVLLLPTTPTTYTIEQVRSDPVQLNTNLGIYTNFVNLLDLAAVAIPAGFRHNGLPFGVSLIGRAFTDEALLVLGDRLHRKINENIGASEIPLSATPEIRLPGIPGCTSLAVVGAHLTGQPLNWQLTSRGARLQKSCRTAPGYRLYALEGTRPPKPGLVRDESFRGPGIEVEVWAVPDHQFGPFVRDVPPPLGVGNAKLQDGTVVKSFICEPYAIAAATEITHFGGWRAYLSNQAEHFSV